MNGIVRIFVTALTGAILVGCSAAPQATETVYVGNEVPPAATPEPTADNITDPVVKKGNRSWRLGWLKDPNRTVLFKDYKEAGVLIAHALADGKFGEAQKDTMWKVQLMPGQSGWGIIFANSGGDADPYQPGATAQVYFKTNGSIDWSKGVREFAIDMGPQFFGLMYSPRDMFDNRVKHSVGLDFKSNSFDKTFETCFRVCDPSGDGYIYTEDPTLLVQVETDAAKALDANMTELIGPNWKTMNP